MCVCVCKLHDQNSPLPLYSTQCANCKVAMSSWKPSCLTQAALFRKEDLLAIRRMKS